MCDFLRLDGHMSVAIYVTPIGNNIKSLKLRLFLRVRHCDLLDVYCVCHHHSGAKNSCLTYIRNSEKGMNVTLLAGRVYPRGMWNGGGRLDKLSSWA